ncbi:carbohydrate binding domain-containing protein [Aquimarina sp. D1M17]|uniref:carbohydrate binding domain-containing protein n=1 Tax=Aquimarina acroporae TaxID=2937283 RepID=UPI0020BE42AB|nr:carbohydrate binding domain-containing protein [Aquimarina acroporae]MCK8521770.1 carbohydrate binding domain-containing protein [Aquimarina acroporae]
MKKLRVLFASFFCVLLWSCSDDDSVTEIIEPSFTVQQSPDDSSVYFFENTTPGKENFYNFWQFDIGGPKFADANGPIERKFEEEGFRRVVLTVVGRNGSAFATEDITVTLPLPDDTRFLLNPENLLHNGYFAEGSGDDFSNWGKFNGEDRITEETSEVQVGFRAAKISNPVDGNPWETQFVADEVPTTDGEKYTASVWIKGDPVVVRFSTNPGVGGDQYAGDYTVTGDWTQYSWTFTANSATTLLALDMGTTAGDFFIDAVELVPGESALPLPSNNSELLNGGLEEGTGNDFTNWGKFNGEDRITEETVEVLGGSRALKVENPADGNPWETQFVSDAFDTVNGDSYTVSMWMKGDPVVVRFSTNPGVGGDQYAGDYTVTADWTKYSWTFTANSDTTLIALDMGTTGGIFYVDDIKVVKD